KKHPLGEKRNHPGSKLRQGFWMVFRLGVNNWGKLIQKGFSLLELTEETSMLSHLKKEVETHYQPKKL
ncbi:hypothetical protein RK835_06850, partial [Streptococcus pneumoniae]|nr:hypothetical protein [Streptococcus pneumoniae]MDS4998670.1 hypothetical protein [Streptococcus pneumoniae]MDS8590317.1 hypothetical protein [Streptococcus pneumoniae]